MRLNATCSSRVGGSWDARAASPGVRTGSLGVSTIMWVFELAWHVILVVSKGKKKKKKGVLICLVIYGFVNEFPMAVIHGNTAVLKSPCRVAHRVTLQGVPSACGGVIAVTQPQGLMCKSCLKLTT